jgi:outer membrane biosynthesis protein TonB
MEIILALVVVAVLGFWIWNSNNAKKDQSSDKHPLDIINDNAVEKQAPYKVPEPAATTPIPLVVEPVQPVVEAKAEVVTEAVKPAKRPAKRPAPAKKPPVKKTAPAKKPAPSKKTTAKKPAV